MSPVNQLTHGSKEIFNIAGVAQDVSSQAMDVSCRDEGRVHPTFSEHLLYHWRAFEPNSSQKRPARDSRFCILSEVRSFTVGCCNSLMSVKGSSRAGEKIPVSSTQDAGWRAECRRVMQSVHMRTCACYST
jgi:hypothetical protein